MRKSISFLVALGCVIILGACGSEKETAQDMVGQNSSATDNETPISTGNREEGTSVEAETDSSQKEEAETTTEGEETETTTESAETETTTESAETETTTKESEDETTSKIDETVTTTTRKPETETTTKKPESATTTKKPETETTTRKTETSTTKPSGNSTSKEEETTATSKKEFDIITDVIELSEWSYQHVKLYVMNYSEDIKWTVADTGIAQIVDGYIYSVYPGTTTLTGTLSGQSVSVKIKVTEGAYGDVDINTDRIALYEGETYKLIATRKGATFKSADSSIATVSSDGTIKGIKAGSTTVTVSHNGTKTQCTVRVVKDDGTYYDSKLSNKYNVATERTMFVSDRIVLRVDAGTPLEDGIMKKLEGLLDAIEKYTGLSYTDCNDKLTDVGMSKKVEINVISNASAYGGSFGATVQPYDLALENHGAYVLLHELTHCIQLRNSVSVGEILTEGLAVYVGEQVGFTLSYPIAGEWGYEEYDWIQNGITADNVEEALVSGRYKYQAGYLFVKYIVDNYGKGKIKELIYAITDEAIARGDGFVPAGIMSSLTNEDICDVIKTTLKSSIIKDFYKYASGCAEQSRTTRTFLNGMKEYDVPYTGHCEDDYWGIEDNIVCDGSIILDFTKAIDYAQKVYGRKFKGIYAMPFFAEDEERITTTFYDDKGNVVEPEYVYIEGYGSMIHAKNAVRVKYEGLKEFDFKHDIRFEFDSDFSESWGL